MVTPGTYLGGRYRVEEQIAGGGMGTVYRATDERLNRTVALKILKDDLARDDRFIERFRREARAAASLSHPNIAAVYDYAEHEGTHYIVMDFVEGRDLARVIREDGPLGEDRSLAICAQICDALHHAHGRGVVHRDVKPGNIMVGRDEHVKVTDFGIARATGESTLTATGSVLGTAQYISPEQANGQAATEVSDIYSLGIVLYEMLTGSVPFTGDSAVAVAMRHLRDEVPAPSVLNTQVGAHADSIVERATNKDPKRRYPTAGAMARDSRQSVTPGARDDEQTAVIPVVASRPTTTLPAGSATARRAMLVSGAALAGLALIATALVVARAGDGRPTRSERRRERASGVQVTTTTPTGTVQVPAVVRQPKSVADEMLKEAGLKPVWVEGESAHEHPKDIVYAADPAPGDLVLPGQTITLSVGTAEPDEGDDDDEERGPPDHAKKKGKDDK